MGIGQVQATKNTISIHTVKRHQILSPSGSLLFTGMWAGNPH